MNPLNYLEGQKTYLTGAIMIIYALSGLFLGHISQPEAMQMIMTGLSIIFLRHSITKI